MLLAWKKIVNNVSTKSKNAAIIINKNFWDLLALLISSNLFFEFDNFSEIKNGINDIHMEREHNIVKIKS